MVLEFFVFLFSSPKMSSWAYSDMSYHSEDCGNALGPHSSGVAGNPADLFGAVIVVHCCCQIGFKILIYSFVIGFLGDSHTCRAYLGYFLP